MHTYKKSSVFSVCTWLFSSSKKRGWWTADLHEIDKVKKELPTELRNLTIKSS